MTAEQLRGQIQFEDSLHPDDEVRARWTNSGHYFQARAAVVRVNLSTVRVRLLERVVHPASLYGSGYGIGHEIVVPRVAAQRWSANNGAFPAA